MEPTVTVPRPDAETTLVEKAYAVLRRAILRGETLPGEKLKIDVLQKEHAISSSPLREALNRLTAEGLVTAEGNRGFRVAPISLEDLQDIVAMRVMLEREAVEASIAQGNDEWEARIVAAFYRLEREEKRIVGDGAPLSEEWSERHRDFHMALLSGTGSRRLINLCASLFDQAERYRRLSAIYRKRPRNKTFEHKRLMEAVLARDAALATALLREHVEKTAQNVANAMKAQAEAAVD
ncbi:GntR family transcriptional regulator [Ferrovibrio sp.]|uniref:GntR family transcriptional regulator n=1 Tax=Ferrovibrio sp. TaxID=1917215 RepID=UPI002612BD80|nr:FCD domain-containing protein [Ferrovibrio sp.]